LLVISTETTETLTTRGFWKWLLRKKGIQCEKK